MSVTACVRYRKTVVGASVAALVCMFGHQDGSRNSFAQTAPVIWTVPEIGALPDDAHGRLVRRGRDLITATYAHIGPEVPDRAKRFAGNNLACGNCHLRFEKRRSATISIPFFHLEKTSS